MRTIDEQPVEPAKAATVEAILTEVSGWIGELRCASMGRLVQGHVSLSHMHVLWLLQHHGSMAMSRLADLLDVSLSNATGIIDRMEEKGLVERVRVPDDRRIVLVRATQAGLDLIDEAELVKSEVMMSAIGRLDGSQLARLTAASGDLGAAIAAVMADNPAYTSIAQCGHAHGLGDRQQPEAIRARDLHESPTTSPRPRPTIAVATDGASTPVARRQPALKEG